jgi:hypothetical protein
MSLARCSLVLMVGFGLVLLCRADDRTGVPAGRDLTVADGTQPRFRGSGSCSATACHGSIVRQDGRISRVRRDEHTVWISDDAHARAYQTLFCRRSQQIVKRLARGQGDPKPAHEDERCLACHTTPRRAEELEPTSWMHADGVGCESCHGPSEKWLGAHTTDTWSGLAPAQKAGFGMTNTSDLVTRGRVCAGCHVGACSKEGLVVRDVNHDLIAAGHPRLYFELSAFLDNMPSHWNERGVNAGPAGPDGRAADFPARAWAVGRLVTLEVSLELLEARAAKATAEHDRSLRASAEAASLPEPLDLPAAGGRPAPWPEFAEYGCFSCHHDLRDQAWRRSPGSAASKPGSPRWGSWTLPLTDELIEHLLPGPVGRSCTSSLEPVKKAMAALGADPRIVADEARKALQPLKSCLESLAAKRWSDDEIKRLLDRLDRGHPEDRAADWDEAAQVFLALTPLHQSRVALDPASRVEQAGLPARLERLRARLAFPTGFDSPRSFDPVRPPVAR